MPKRKISARYVGDHIRRVLKDGGSAPHADGVRHFFKEEIRSRGWYTAELRKVAVRFRRAILRERGREFLIEVADDLFRGRMLEEKVFAVFLLEKQTALLGKAEFEIFESWLSRISSWAEHDALAHYLIAPMLVATIEKLRMSLGSVMRARRGRPAAQRTGSTARPSRDACDPHGHD